MIPWTVLGTAPVPGSAEVLRLARRGDEFAITILGQEGELMNSRVHFSEDELGRLAAEAVRTRPAPHVLVGGLGMGFTLAAALKALPDAAQVTVAELVPGVVAWNRGDLGVAAGRPLDDPRTRIVVADVGEVLRASPAAFDAVALDVDNGPEGLTRPANDGLYSARGLAVAARALRPGGVLAVWSATTSEAFTARLRGVGFVVETKMVRARAGKGGRHTVWVGRLSAR